MDGHPNDQWRRMFVSTTLCAIALYILAWRDVPLVFDEASFRRLYGRAFVDGFLVYSLYPACAEPKPVPFLFVPSHIVFSWIDSWPSWAGVRVLPIVSVAALVLAASLLTFSQKPSSTSRIWSFPLLCGGFVGLSGTSLVLSRWEYLVTLQITMCLITWVVVRRESVSPLIMASVLLAHLFVIMLSLFVHLQGLLVMPLSFVTCMLLLRKQRWLAFGVAALLVTLSFQSLIFNQFQCPEDPELESAIASTQGSGLSSQLAEYPLIERMARRAVYFERQFFFQYQEEMFIPTPQLPELVATAINPLIAAVVTLNLLGLGLGFCYALVLLWRDHFVSFRPGQWRQFVWNVAVDGRALWALGAFLLLFYSLNDFGGAFYRAHFRNLLSALLLAIAASHVAGTFGHKWLKPWSILSATTCIASALVAWIFLAPQLAYGYESNFVSLQRDWPAFNNRVRALASRCGITEDEDRVVVDVATYNAMREHHRPIDFLYVFFDEYLKGTPSPGRTQRQWLDRYKQFSSSGYIVRCQSLQFVNLPVQYRDDDICCLGF